MMISAKKLIKMARKWRRMAAIGRKRISLPGVSENSTCSSTKPVKEGHFVVYTVDAKRFVFPIAYLNTYVFRELLLRSEEEFGLPSDGPITFPCDASFMSYAANLIRHQATLDMEKALLMSLANNRCSSSMSIRQQQTNQQLMAYAY